MEKQPEHKFTFTWIIEEFKISPLYTTTYSGIVSRLHSPEFAFSFLPDVKWVIKLHSLSDTAYIILYPRNDISANSRIRYRIEAFDFNGNPIFSFENTKYATSFEKKLLRSVINDILILKFTFSQKCEANQPDLLPPLSYKNGLFADVLLRAGGAEFKVHKAILCARWPKLAENLNKEKTSQLVLDIPSNVLEAILKYVYMGKMDFSGNELSAEVSAAAVKYELPHLICIPVVAQKCRTRPNVQNVSFEWPINNFSKLAVNTVLRSHVFILDASRSCRWNLIFYLREDALHGRIFDISVCRESDSAVIPIFVRIHISFDETNSSEYEYLFLKDLSWKCAKFSRSISTDPEDILLLKCDLKFFDFRYDSKTVQTSYAFASTGNCRYLSSDMENLFQSGTLSDVDIIVGSDTLRAHKFILCARSSVFSRMFDSQMMESKTNCVTISDVDSWVINKMFLFLYSGNFDPSREYMTETMDVMELYAAADKYDIPTLKKKCASYLKSNLSVQNVCKVLQLADVHSDDDLYESVFEFISAHAEEIFSTCEWKEISKNNICAKLLAKAIIRKNSAK
ncbi:speckle-type POZ protein-like [Stegodyphus dumicola]|uniref:speckle-type POZ protein-like n=1 Tax=Stegodyphus dumicola TaxID=202533 RepID=UPI0015AC6372|nr:speckle-type POZ protein-like [Stegodyphus dumicola]